MHPSGLQEYYYQKLDSIQCFFEGDVTKFCDSKVPISVKTVSLNPPSTSTYIISPIVTEGRNYSLPSSVNSSTLILNSTMFTANLTINTSTAPDLRTTTNPTSIFVSTFTTKSLVVEEPAIVEDGSYEDEDLPV
jgi:hypothetical protein